MIKLLLAHSVLTVAIGSVILATLERGSLCKDSALLNHARALILLGCVYFTILVSLYGCTRCGDRGVIMGGKMVYPSVSSPFLTLLALVFGATTMGLYLVTMTGIKDCANLSSSQIDKSTLLIVLLGVLPSFVVVLRALFPGYQWVANKLSSMPPK